MKIGMLSVGFLALIPFAQAALPPLYQSLAEYKALIEDSELTSHLDPGEVLTDIQRDDKTFTIHTTKSVMEVEVIYDPIKRPGPAKFHFQFHLPQPK